MFIWTFLVPEEVKHLNPIANEKGDADNDVSAATANSATKKMTVDNEGLFFYFVSLHSFSQLL